MGDARNWSEWKLDGYRRKAGIHLPPLSNLRLQMPDDTDRDYEARVYCPYCRRTRALPLAALPPRLRRMRWRQVLGRLRCERCGARPSEAAFWTRLEPASQAGVVLTFDPRA